MAHRNASGRHSAGPVALERGAAGSAALWKSGPPVGQSVATSFGGSLGRLVDPSVDRRVDRSIRRSAGRSVDPSVDPSVGSVGRSVDPVGGHQPHKHTHTHTPTGQSRLDGTTGQAGPANAHGPSQPGRRRHG